MYMVTGQIHINIIIIVMATRESISDIVFLGYYSLLLCIVFCFILLPSRGIVFGFNMHWKSLHPHHHQYVDCAECVCRRLQCNMSPLYLIDGWLALLVVYGVLCEGGILSVEQKKESNAQPNHLRRYSLEDYNVELGIHILWPLCVTVGL